MRHLRNTYEMQVRNGHEIRAGDIVVVTGRVEASPVVLPDRFPTFQNALMVVKQHEERRSGFKRRRWHDTRRLVWKSDVRNVGGWHLDDSVIEYADFAWFRASPCDDFEPPAGWVSNCPFSDYVKLENDSSRRFSYLVTPIPDEPVTLIAAASSTPGTLTAFTYARVMNTQPFAFVARGTWTGDALLTRHLHRKLVGMGVLICIIFLIAWWFSYRMRRRSRYFGKDRTIVNDLFRAAIITAPYAVIFWPTLGKGALWAVLIAAAISSLLVLAVRAEGGRAHQSSFE